METKNVVIAMLCASIAILSVATPISAVDLTNSGIGGGINGDGSVTGEVVVSARGNPAGTGSVEASMEATAEMNGPGAAVCFGSADLTSTLTTPLGTIGADSEGSVVAAVAVEEEGSASADAYVGTEVSLDASEVKIESEISSGTGVATNGGSASASASATGTTSGEGVSYATGGAPDDAYSYAYVSGATVANAAGKGIAGASSFAVVRSTDYAGHNEVRETSNIRAVSYAWSDDGNASADSFADGVAYQEGQAENCARSATYANGTVGTAAMTMGPAYAYAGSNANIRSYDRAHNGPDGAYLYESSGISTESYANSDNDSEALAFSGADGYTYAAGSACDCVYSRTFANGTVDTAAMTMGPASARSNANINSRDSARNGTDGAYVSEDSDIYTSSYADSDTYGEALAFSVANGDTYAAGSACDCVYSRTFANGTVDTAAMTMGPASARSNANINSHDSAHNGTDYAYVYERSNIHILSRANSVTYGEALAFSGVDGYTYAAGSACNCVYSDTYANGTVNTAASTMGNASAWKAANIGSHDYTYLDTDEEGNNAAGVQDGSYIEVRGQIQSGPGGGAFGSAVANGDTYAAGSACDCVYSWTYANGTVDTAAMTMGPAYADSFSHIRSTDEAHNATDGAYVDEHSSIYVGSYAASDTDGEALAFSGADGYTYATGSACGCIWSWTNAMGTVDATAASVNDSWISTYARLTSDGRIVIGNQKANSVIVTGATAMHDSNSTGTATADGFTQANAANACTGEWVGTGIEDGVGVTIVNPFDVMGTWTFAGFAYAYANPTGFEKTNQTVFINTSGPTNVAFSCTEAIATTP